MIHYVNTTVTPADLHAAAADKNMTVQQFEAWAIKHAVEEHKRHKDGRAALLAALQDTIGAVPGGD